MATKKDTQQRADPDPLMAIGMFSRASLVSMKSLRSYHEQGLLVPDSIDAATGYRSYRVSQLADAAIIRRLRDLDVPLRDVAAIVAARDPEITRSVMERHEATMQDRLASVARIVDELQHAIELPSAHTPIHIRDEAPAHALSYTGRVRDAQYGPFLEIAYRALFAAAEMTGAVALGAGSARYPDTVEHEKETVEAYVPIRDPVPVAKGAQDLGVVLTLIPAATCAVATHVGSYETIGDTYRQLGSWVARHRTPSNDPIREHYVVSTDEVTRELLPTDQLRTEICWPVVPAETDTSNPTTSTRTRTS